MGYRRQSRELALQALFYLEANKSSAPGPEPDHESGHIADTEEQENLLSLFCSSFEKPINDEVKSFFLALVKGVTEYESEVDLLLNNCSKNWKLSRMPAVDRNIMRIGAYELLKCPDIPSKVTINEAVEIGKKFGDKGSAPFINGVLDQIRILKNIE